MATDTWSREEIIGRWKRMQDKMAATGLDGLLVGEASNFRYFTGQTSPQFLHRMRPLVFLLPQRGDPAMFIYASEGKRLAVPSFITMIKTYVDVPPYPIADLAKAMDELGMGRGVIGVELGEYQRLGIPVNDYLELQRLLPSATWRDAGPALVEVQSAKSAEEIDALRKACALSQRAWEVLLTRVHPGTTTAEIERLLAIANLEQGADAKAAVPSHVTHLSTGSRDGVLRQGDILKGDFHTSYQGQWSDICRMAVVGEPTAQHKAAHQKAYAMLSGCLAELRPGRKAREIAIFNNEQRTALGLPILNANKRMGHGVGLEATTAPSLNLVDETVLVPGMAIAVEPGFESEFGPLQIEEVAVITKTGHEMLSSGGDAIGVIR